MSPTIEKIHQMRNMILVMFHFGSIQMDVSFQPDEDVEVLQDA